MGFFGFVGFLKKPIGFFRFFSKPKKPDNDNDNDNGNGIDIENENDIVITWVNGNNSNGSNIYRKDDVSGEETRIASNISGESYADTDWNTLQDGVYQYGVANLYSQKGVIYEEGFESISTSTLYDENNPNWYYYNENCKYNWEIAESFSTGQVNNPTIFTPFMGNKAAFIKSFAKNKTYLTYLVTDPMDYIQYAGNELLLSFYYITPAWGSDVNTLHVMISVESNNSGWTELWSSNKTNVSDWTKAEVDISDYIGQKFHIAFVNSAGYGYCTGLDEVTIFGDGSKESRIEWSEKIYKNIFDHEGLAENNNHKFAYHSGDELIIGAEGVVQIIDMMGRLLYSDNVAGDNNRIDMSRFNSATYIIRLINADGVRVQKIILQ